MMFHSRMFCVLLVSCISATRVHAEDLKPGDTFNDCDECPQMVVVPAGEFMMGSPASEADRQDDEGPQRKVTITEPFAVGKFAITRGEFATFVKETGHKTDGGCVTWTGPDWRKQALGGSIVWTGERKKEADKSWRDPGFAQDDRHPVVCVNWNDAKAYVAWVAKTTGKTYRLLTEAEWEYAARAGTTTPFSTGENITSDQANFNGISAYVGVTRGEYRERTIDVGSFGPNAFRLHDMHGNAWEWVEDCYQKSYKNVPVDGSALTSGDCKYRVLRGGSWASGPWTVRSAFRHKSRPDLRDYTLGFRVARTLPRCNRRRSKVRC